MDLTATRPARRAPRLAQAAFAVAVVLVACVGTASAASVNPTSNMPIAALPDVCTDAPLSDSCETAVVAELDRARGVLDLGGYRLPRDFNTLAAEQQLFILTNLDRGAYGLAPITELSPALARASTVGVAHDADPDPTSVLDARTNSDWRSNWAGAYGNVLLAYYAWMYDDGYAGSETSNVDCTAPTAAGCWGHRDNVLARFATGARLSMGASAGIDASGEVGYAMIIAATRPTSPAAIGSPRTNAGANLVAATRIAAAPVKSRSHVVRFHLTAAGGASSRFQCALVRHTVAATSRPRPAHPRFSACHARVAYPHLSSGDYTFYARTGSGTTSDPAPANRRFRVR